MVDSHSTLLVRNDDELVQYLLLVLMVWLFSRVSGIPAGTNLVFDIGLVKKCQFSGAKSSGYMCSGKSLALQGAWILLCLTLSNFE